MTPADGFLDYIYEVDRRTSDRLGVTGDSFDDIAAELGVSFEEALERWEMAKRAVQEEMAVQGITQPPPPSPDEYLASLDLSEDVKPVDRDRVGDDEAWHRLTQEPHVRGIGAARTRDPGWPWSVTVWVMEFVRDEPLESELRVRIGRALRSVAGVTGAMEEDREVWVVQGSPSGDALVRAVAEVVDDLAPLLRPYVQPPRS